MVCKEEFLSWFKDLDSHKRIDMLCELINMCMPFELRFVGSYLEEIGKHSYQELRQQAIFANDLEKLDKDVMFKTQSLYEETVRHRVLVNISLLKSRNYSVANWYSRKFLRTDYIEELVSKEKDDLAQNELLLLFTMASKHPAFTFDQKQFFSRMLLKLYEVRESRCNKSGVFGYPPGFGYPTFFRKVQDASPFPVSFPPIHPPGLPQFDFMSHLRGFPGIPCGAPGEVPPFPPPQPATSPLVSSPNQSRSASPHRTRPPTIPILSSPASAVTIPPVAVVPSAVVPPQSHSTIPGPPVTLPLPAPVIAPMPAMLPVPMEALATPPQPAQQNDCCDELNATLKEELSIKPPPLAPPNAWSGPPGGSEIKQINGLRIAPFPQGKIRTSIADQMHSLTLTDESSHYQSSSSNSSPLQTPPDTPSNMSSTAPPHGPGRGPIDNNRNGLPNFISFGDATSPPPPPAFTFPAYAPMPPNRFYGTTMSPNFRPTSNSGGFAPFVGGLPYPASSETQFVAPAYSMTSTSLPYLSLMYSSYAAPGGAPPQAPAPRGPPTCYNCGGLGHAGPDCQQQSIDDITQKRIYSVEFGPVPTEGNGGGGEK